MRFGFVVMAAMLGASVALAQQTDDLSQVKDSSRIGPDGTAYVTRVVPVPPHSLPLTSSGKLSRSRARAMYLEGAFEPRPAATAAE